MASENSKSVKNIFTTNDIHLTTLKRPGKSTQTRIKLQTTSLWCLCLIFLFASCQSTQKMSYANLENSNFIPLDSGGSLYIVANVRQALPIFDLLSVEKLNDKQINQMLKKTDYFAAAIFPEKDGKIFQSAAWGNYPKFSVALALSFDRRFKKQRSADGAYWYSNADGLSLILNSKQAFVVFSGNNVSVNPAAASGVEMPQGFREFSLGYPVSCWLENPASLIAVILSKTGVPVQFSVQQIFINLYYTARNQCEALIRMQFENASYARAMTAILNLAGNFSADSPFAALFFANPPVLNGRNINIKTSPLSGEELSLLLEMYLLYLT